MTFECTNCQLRYRIDDSLCIVATFAVKLSLRTVIHKVIGYAKALYHCRVAIVAHKFENSAA